MTVTHPHPTSTESPATRLERLGVVSTYPPTRCGIAKFSQSLVMALKANAPDIEIDIVRLVDGWAYETPAVGPVMEIVPELPIARRAAAKRLDSCDVVILQHEFGIYGPENGKAVLDLAQRINRPTITTLHTVLENSSPAQQEIVESLAELSAIVVPSEAARQILSTSYDIDSRSVYLIRHGAWWLPRGSGRGSRNKIITWGLIGPGKGLERAIRALPMLRHVRPRPKYQIVGGTHPNVARQQGLTYRHMLEALAVETGVSDMVEFVDQYLSEDELENMVRESDIVLLPYDNDSQISSGVMTEALAAGKPVVATRFPYAVELLDGGAGIIVSHDSSELAGGIERLLTDPDVYDSCAAGARRLAPQLSWVASGQEYLRLARELVRVDASDSVSTSPFSRRV